MKATVLGLGLLTSGTAMANDNFGGSPLYNPQYSYYGPGIITQTTGTIIPGIPTIILAITTFTVTPTMGGIRGTGYPYWDPTAAWHPYSKTNPNWIPYVGWR